MSTFNIIVLCVAAYVLFLALLPKFVESRAKRAKIRELCLAAVEYVEDYHRRYLSFDNPERNTLSLERAVQWVNEHLPDDITVDDSVIIATIEKVIKESKSGPPNK